MKNIILIALLALALVIPSQAGQLTTSYNGGTNIVASATTNTTGQASVLYFGNTTQAYMDISFKLQSGSVVSNLTVNIDTSLDSVRWTTNALSFTAASGAGVKTTQYFFTNAPPFVRVGSIANANADSVLATNVTVNAFVKTGL